MSAFIWPLASYTISSPFGPRDGGQHQGIDMAAPLGTPINASADGTVAAAGAASGFGDWIVLDHIIGGKKWSTVYGHMYPAGLHVIAGQVVKQGQHIADVGANGEATGPHCHFETWDGGRLTGGKAVDPAGVVGGDATSINGGLAKGSGEVNGVSTLSGPLGIMWSFVQFIIDPHNWWRVFLYLCGLGAILYVVWSTMNGTANG